MRKIILALTALAALATPLALSAPAEATSTMGVSRAGHYYLTQICNNNAADDRVSDALPTKANGWWYTRDLTPRVFARVKAATANAARVHHESARRLFNPPAAWPTSVAGMVDRMATGVEQTSSIYAAVSRARNPQGFTRIWQRFNNVDLSRLTGQIRARLNLPAPGRGC